MPIFVLLIIAAIAGGGIASTNAKPGDGLFPVKLTVETVQETFTFDSKTKANLQAEHALLRLKEVQANVSNGNSKGLAQAIANLEEKIKAAADSVRSSGDVALAKKIQDRLVEVENGINDLSKSTVTGTDDDSLLADAKDLLEIEKDRVGTIATPEKAKDLLRDALERANKEASDSAKKIDNFKAETSQSRTPASTETKQATQSHNSIVHSETTTIEKEQAAPAPTSTTTSGSTTKVEDSGTSGKNSTSSGSGSGSGH